MGRRESLTPAHFSRLGVSLGKFLSLLVTPRPVWTLARPLDLWSSGTSFCSSVPFSSWLPTSAPFPALLGDLAEALCPLCGGGGCL